MFNLSIKLAILSNLRVKLAISSDLRLKSTISPNLSPKLAQNIFNLENCNSKSNNAKILDLSLYALAASSYFDFLNQGTSILKLDKMFKKPTSYKEAIGFIYKNSSLKLCKLTLKANKIQQLVSRPKAVKPTNLTLIKNIAFKARFVAKGYN